MTVLLWLSAIMLMAIGLAGTVLPVLPGPALIFAGILLAAWIEEFARIPAWSVVLSGGLAALSLACDYLAAMLGARHLGASRQAILGAAFGTLLGIFTGLWGLLFMPLLGAALGEFLAHRDAGRAGRVGLAAWVGMLAGAAIKIAIAFAMTGIFVVALLF